MSVSSISTVTASSPASFQDAFDRGFARAQRTLRGIQEVEVVSEKVSVDGGAIKEYIVELKIIFALEN